MRVSISVTAFGGDIAAELAETAQMADEGGLDTLWVADHLLQADPRLSEDDPMLEAYTTLGFLAARTSRIRLGTLVTAVTFRPPAVLVKAVTTLHELSGERAWLGLGAGYNTDEAEAMGVPLPPMRERFERLEETLEIAERMWAGDESPYHGRHHRLERPLGWPRPQKRPRLLIGGMGERRTLPLVARRADACNLFDLPDGGETVRHKLAVLARCCEEAGRDPATVEKTLSSRLAPGETAEAFAERCRGLQDMGFDHVVLVPGAPWAPDELAVACDGARLLA
jgi:F420-dependent oxidoreductase-like protein